jgi:uncharacterized membrane protein
VTRAVIGTVAASLALAILVHGVSLVALPHMATRNAYSRLEARAPTNQLSVLPDPAPGGDAVPFLDPAFVVAVCRYDLSAGPVAITFEHGPTYATASFYTPHLIAFATLNDRAGSRGSVSLDLVEQGRRRRPGADADNATPARPVIESPTRQGLVVIRLLAAEPSMRPDLRKRLERATCAAPPQG